MADRRLGAVFFEIRGRTEFLQKDLADAEQQFGKLSKFVLDNPVAAIAGVSTALVGVALGAAKMAAGIESAMQRVAVSTAGGAEGIGQLRDRIRELSRETGQSQEDLARAAEVAARQSESVEGTGQRLAAALKLSQVAGADTTATLNSLDQVLDLFNLKSTDAADAVAELFAAARGRTTVDELFASLSAAAPTIQKLGLDLPTAARALVTLGESGLEGKKLVAAFKEIADSGAGAKERIRGLAAAIKDANDPTRILADAYDKVNKSAENLGKRVRADFADVMLELGNRVLPLVSSGLEHVIDLFDRLRGRASRGVLQGAITDISEFGGSLDVVSKRGNDKTDVLLDRVTVAVARLGEASKKGALDLSSLTDKQLAALRSGLEGLQKAPILDNKAFGLGATKQGVQELLTLIGQIPKAPPKTGGTAGSIVGVTADDLKKLEEQQKALRDLEEGFADLFQKASTGSISLEDFDKGLRELGDKFTDTANKTTALSSRFAELKSSAAGVRQALDATRADKATAEFLKLRNALLPEAFRTFADTISAMRDELANKNITGDAADELINLAKLADDSKRALTELDRKLAVIGESGLNPLQKSNLLLQEQQDLEAQLIALSGQRGVDVEIKRAAINERLLKIQQAFNALGEANAANLKSAEVATNGLADGLANAGQAALGISTAILGANSEITRAIAGAAQLAQSFRDVVKLATDSATGITDFGKLFSSGAGVASALPAIGGIIGGIGSIVAAFSQRRPDPVEEERNRILQENNERLKQLRDELAHQVGQSITGEQRQTLTSLARAQAPTQREVGRDPITGDPILEDVPRTAQEILADLEKVGVGLDKLRDAAKAVGVELSANPTAEELAQLTNALFKLDFQTFANTFAGQLEQLNDEFELFPDKFKSNADKFAATVKLLNDPNVGAPALFKALAGIDTSTVDGAKQAQAAIQQLFNRLRDGSLTQEDLGGLSLEQFRQTLKTLSGELGITAESTTAAFDTITKALAALANELDVLDITDASTRARRIVETVAGLVPSIQDALGNFDLNTLSGAQGFDEAIKNLFLNRNTLSALQRGGLSIDEFTQLLLQLDNALDTSKGALQDQIQAAFDKAKAEEAAAFAAQDAAQKATEQARAEAVRQAIENAKNASTFDGDTTAQRIARVVEALAPLTPALNGLLDGLDLETADGIFQLNQRLQDLFTSLGADSDLGSLSLSELLSVLLDLRGSSDDLAKSLTHVTDAVQTAADRLRAAFDQLDFSLELNNITDPIERLRQTAIAAAGAIPEVAKALAGLDLASEDGRRAAEAALVALGNSSTDQAVRDAVLKLLAGIRGIPSATPVGGGVSSPFEQQQAISLQGSPTLTAVQGSQWLDIGRSQLTELRKIVENTAKSFAATFTPRVDPSLLLRPPVLPSLGATATSASGGVVIRIEQTVNIGGDVTPQQKAQALDLSDAIVRRIQDALRRLGDIDDLNNGLRAR